MQRNECKPGTEVIIRGTISEDDGTDFNSIKITILPDGVLLNRNNYLSVACIKLVKPIEEIEAEQPYRVEEMAFNFRVTRDIYYMHTIWWNSDACLTSPYNKEEALRKAQELCDELNRKHQESLNA